MTTGRPDAGRGHGREDMDRDEDTDDTTFQTWLIKLAPMSQVTSGAITASACGNWARRVLLADGISASVLVAERESRRHRYGGHIA
jgi:hypothetical protein